MKKLTMYAAIAISSVACSFSTAGDQVPSPSNDYGLSADQINRLRERAKGGDREAIKDLVAHYLIHEQDHETSMHWLERLGDMGDVDAQDSVIGYYDNRKSMVTAKDYAKRLRERWRRN